MSTLNRSPKNKTNETHSNLQQSPDSVRISPKLECTKIQVWIMITLILIILASICNSIMDVLFTRYNKSIFKKYNPSWWNPKLSWEYKWKMPLQPPIKKWYYFGVYPQYEEKFPYSSTIFVFITDAWHLSKSLMLLFIMLSIVNYVPLINPYIDWFLYYITWTSIFTYLYIKGFIGK